MIKIIININEEKEDKFKKIKATSVECSVSAELKNPTPGEVKVMNIINKRLKPGESVEIVNMCEDKSNKEKVENIEKIIERVIKIM